MWSEEADNTPPPKGVVAVGRANHATEARRRRCVACAAARGPSSPQVRMLPRSSAAAGEGGAAQQSRPPVGKEAPPPPVLLCLRAAWAGDEGIGEKKMKRKGVCSYLYTEQLNVE